ncbi:ureidoglycolate lyase [Gordonia sp. PP30]|uniref:ureidoglycolate lyase n=1 Tax=unclassified Gordonia (in: high G+C Gram-positive bacteria) TaxID=2657482 RepID=UPI0020001151|nr:MULTISPECIES: ureidoglycolate lyase [unclassified Gordonia (in: high G+C Gram-positive bacteria)]UQE74161.1 ureidoglycolate lyase [Gordonia sp. PP30]
MTRTEPRAIPVRPLTEAAFAQFGEVLAAVPDGESPRPGERLLDLSGGLPRFYVMALHDRPARLTAVTRHRRVTQVLAAVGGTEWILAVAPPGDPDDPDARPDIDDIAMFRVPGDVAVLLLRGTWHAGPFFGPSEMAFFNLELDDTNQADHQTHAFGVELIAAPGGDVDE